MLSSYQLFLFIASIALIVLEAIVSMRNNLQLYNFRDTSTSLVIYCGSIIANLVFRGVSLSILGLIYKFSLVKLDFGFYYWIWLFILCDLTSYGFHFLSHKSRFFWASHVIHHSSEKFNLSTATRLSFTNFFYRFLIFIPLCLAGFRPFDVLMMDLLIIVYNFFLHTELIRKIGWLELFLNTPSHHRVHHGCNEKYIDKNFGGILIIWDRIFNTFQAETEKPIYGITTPLKSTNPIKIIISEWVPMFKETRKAKSFFEFLRILFRKP